MADSAPAATSTARAIRLIPLSAPHGVGFTTLVFISMSAIPLGSADSFLTFVAAIVEHSNQKMALFPCGMLLAIWALVRLGCVFVEHADCL